MFYSIKTSPIFTLFLTFSLQNLLWHMVISKDPWYSHLLPRIQQWSVTTCFNDLGLSQPGFKHPTFSILYSCWGCSITKCSNITITLLKVIMKNKLLPPLTLPLTKIDRGARNDLATKYPSTVFKHCYVLFFYKYIYSYLTPVLYYV